MNKHLGSNVVSLFSELGELGKVRLLATKKIVAEKLRRSTETKRVAKRAPPKRAK